MIISSNFRLLRPLSIPRYCEESVPDVLKYSSKQNQPKVQNEASGLCPPDYTTINLHDQTYLHLRRPRHGNHLLPAKRRRLDPA